MTPILAKEKTGFQAGVELLQKAVAGQQPSWLETLRREAGVRFESINLPTTRDEEWKYTNLSPLLKLPIEHSFVKNEMRLTSESIEPFAFSEARANLLVFIDGRFAPEHSTSENLPTGVIAGSIADLASSKSALLSAHLGKYAADPKDALTALNTAMLFDGAVVYVPERIIVETPIHLLFVSSGGATVKASHPRVLLIAEAGSIATVIETYVGAGEGAYFTNAVTEVYVAGDARLDHYRLQEESDNAFHVGTTSIAQEGASYYGSCAIALGAKLARHNLDLILKGQRSESVVNGLYVVSEGQHSDSHTTIDHANPNCVSHQLYKGIIDGNGRAVFNGKILVRKGALHTDSRQLNKNLLLSDEATVDTKPQLEIFADDVKCAHGATVGQLEDEELFYLASRGINPEKARALLTYGFAEDVISKIPLASVRNQLDRIVLDKLHQNLEVQ